jgi:5-hydroxyisourate hydrolase
VGDYKIAYDKVVEAMSGISTHVLDTSAGRPAAGVAVTLERWELDAWLACASAVTDPDGRCKQLLAPENVLAGRYRLTFATGDYFEKTLYPEIAITFEVTADAANYHIPLLLNPFGYTTYRGS